jgi:hypothetical protein
MSQRRIKKSNGQPQPKEAALDWIRTDNDSMVEYFFITLMTRGLYPVLEQMMEALTIESEACRNQKAAAAVEVAVGNQLPEDKITEAHNFWLRNAEFCEDTIAEIRSGIEKLQQKWGIPDGDDARQPTTARRKQPIVGGMYPLPWHSVYIPKK